MSFAWPGDCCLCDVSIWILEYLVDLPEVVAVSGGLAAVEGVVVAEGLNSDVGQQQAGHRLL